MEAFIIIILTYSLLTQAYYNAFICSSRSEECSKKCFEYVLSIQNMYITNVLINYKYCIIK